MSFTFPAAIVYLATNRINGKRYVGATSKGVVKRRREHISEALRGGRNCRLFHAAIRKYGPDAFEWMVISSAATFPGALDEEVRLIAEIKPEYNLTVGGQGSKGRIATQEQRDHQSRVRMGKKLGPEHGRKTALGMIGKKHTPERRAKISAARKGARFSDEHRRHLSLSHTGLKQSQETIEKRQRSAALRLRDERGRLV